jgi:hypothetical protein
LAGYSYSNEVYHRRYYKSPVGAPANSPARERWDAVPSLSAPVGAQESSPRRSRKAPLSKPVFRPYRGSVARIVSHGWCHGLTSFALRADFLRLLDGGYAVSPTSRTAAPGLRPRPKCPRTTV